LFPHLFNLAVEISIIEVQNHEGLNMIGLNHVIIYTDVDLLGDNINTIRRTRKLSYRSVKKLVWKGRAMILAVFTFRHMLPESLFIYLFIYLV